MTSARKRVGASRTAASPPSEPELTKISSPDGSDALGSPRRGSGWAVFILRAAVYMTVIMAGELLLWAYLRLVDHDLGEDLAA